MVHSTKHYVQTSISSITGGAVGVIIIANAVPVGDKNLASEVEEGNSLKAVYIEHWIKAGEASNSGSFVATLMKVPGGGSTFSFAEMAALHDAENKKNILYTTQGLMNINSGSATNISKQWYKIPKGKQRFGLGDRLVFEISAAATIDLDHCGVAIYKEYS